MEQPARTRSSLVLAAQILLVAVVSAVTVFQILRPAVNHDIRFVLGSFITTAGAGLSWTGTWAHRPFTARAVIAFLSWLSPGEFATEEAWIRFWSVLMAIGAAVLLWRGLVPRFPPRLAAWNAIAVGAALAWAPGWDFAEPEWYATVFAIAAIGVALRRSWGPFAAGALLALVILMKFTTITIAIAAVLAILALDRRRGPLTGMLTVLATFFLFAITILIEPREWQWLLDMPSLNPDLTWSGMKAAFGEGLVNSLVVSPVTAGALVAIGFLIIRGGERRRVGWVLLALFAVLALPFVMQQQNFLYHLTAVPIASAVLVASVAANSSRTPLALSVTGALGLIASASLFRMGPRTRDANWWIADVYFGVVLAVGFILMLVELRRGTRGPRPDTPVNRVISLITVSAACLAPLLVTVLPWSAYSFSLAHSRTTADVNAEQAAAGPERRADFNAVLGPDVPVIYLSFSAPYYMRNPTPCGYASPTFLQRATGDRAEEIRATHSFQENLNCLAVPAEAIVIERNWFRLDRVHPDVRQAIDDAYDCAEPLLDDSEWLICPTK